MLIHKHQFLDEESDKTVSLIPKENKPGELPVRQYTLSMLKEQEESKSTIRIKREYPDVDVFILLLGGSRVEESIYKHMDERGYYMVDSNIIGPHQCSHINDKKGAQEDWNKAVDMGYKISSKALKYYFHE